MTTFDRRLDALEATLPLGGEIERLIAKIAAEERLSPVETEELRIRYRESERTYRGLTADEIIDRIAIEDQLTPDEVDQLVAAAQGYAEGLPT